MDSRLSKTLAVPLISGAVAAAEASYLYSSYEGVQVPLLGRVSAPLGMAVHTALASMVSESAGQYVLPYLEGGHSYSDIATKVSGPVITGLANSALLNVAGNSVPMSQAFLVGASSNLIGQYVADMWHM